MTFATGRNDRLTAIGSFATANRHCWTGSTISTFDLFSISRHASDAGPGISDDHFYRFLQRTWMLQSDTGRAHSILARRLVLGGMGCHRSRRRLLHDALVHSARRTPPGSSGLACGGCSGPGLQHAWLAIPTMGESWHCNHHAFPASARHGLYPGQIDPGFWFVEVRSGLGLASNIQGSEQSSSALGTHAANGSRVKYRGERPRRTLRRLGS